MFFKGKIPFLRLLIPFVLGILFAWFFPNALSLSPAFTVLLTAMGILAIHHVFYRHFPLYQFRWFFGLLIHVAVCQLAYIHTLFSINYPGLRQFSQGSAKVLLVQVKTEPIIRNGVARFESNVLYSDTSSTQGQLLVALKLKDSSTCEVAYGDVLFIPATYHEVEPPYNPGEFDYKSYLRTHGILYQSFIHESQIKLMAKNKGNSLVAFALSLRKKMVAAFAKHLHKAEAAAMAATLILGYRADLSPELVSTYAQTGTLHILSVSGMHVALVFILLSFLLRPLDRLPRTKFVKAMLLIGLIWFYALITGFSPSVNRAAFMLSFIVLGKAIDKGMDTYNLLAISAFFLLVYHPFYLFDIGFQLSYLAVLGLVAVHPVLYSWFYFKNKIVDAVWSYTALSISAQVFTFPLSLYIFHQFPLSFLISNLVVVLPISGVMYVGMAFVFFSPFNMLLPYLGWILNQLINFSNTLLYAIAKAPFSSIQGLFINRFELFMLYAFSVVLVVAIRLKRKRVFVASICILIMHGAITLYQHISQRHQSTLIFYSLRKNTAIAHLSASKAVVVTDLADTDKTFQFSIKPSLGKAKTEKSYPLNRDFQEAHTAAKGPFLQCGEHVIFRWTPNLNTLHWTKKVKVNTVLISQNPKLKLHKLKSMLQFDCLLIDASNSDYNIHRWVEEAQKLNLRFLVLKKSPALVLNLK